MVLLNSPLFLVIRIFNKELTKLNGVCILLGLLGSVAPCVLFGSNVERLAEAPGTFANSCLPYTGLYMLGNSLFGWNCLAPWFSHPTRTAIRRRYNLEASFLYLLISRVPTDFLFFFSTVIQMIYLFVVVTLENCEVGLWAKTCIHNTYSTMSKLFETNFLGLRNFCCTSFRFVSCNTVASNVLTYYSACLIFRVTSRPSLGNVGAAVASPRMRRGVST
jgi:hypothetical protein